MNFFTGKDSDDEEAVWTECNDPKCTRAGQAHYHKTVIYSTPSQSNTLDSWFPHPPKKDVSEMTYTGAPARWKYKYKGLGRVRRYRRHPYDWKKVEIAKSHHVTKMKD